MKVKVVKCRSEDLERNLNKEIKIIEDREGEIISVSLSSLEGEPETNIRYAKEGPSVAVILYRELRK